MTYSNMLQIKENYQAVFEKIKTASDNSRNRAKPVKIVVVSKMHKIETIQFALEAGISDFGENYLEEAAEKIDYFSNNPNITWHMIGHIQSRKANLVVSHFDLVHSVDSNKLAVRINRFANDCGKKIKILLECNLSGEETKFGYHLANKSNWAEFSQEIEQLTKLPNLEITGLMTMPPLFSNAENSRPYFSKLRELQEYLQKQFPEVRLNELSMGTSSDYIIAVEEGATIVRIGTAILGTRI